MITIIISFYRANLGKCNALKFRLPDSASHPNLQVYRTKPKETARMSICEKLQHTHKKSRDPIVPIRQRLQRIQQIHLIITSRQSYFSAMNRKQVVMVGANRIELDLNLLHLISQYSLIVSMTQIMFHRCSLDSFGFLCFLFFPKLPLLLLLHVLLLVVVLVVSASCT